MSTHPSIRPKLGGGTRRSPSDAPPSNRNDQEFLFHLYRGSELLQENSVDEAKAELERALKLQPRDVEGQALLGVVYFRLGLYPRAIEVFERICESNPTEVAPQINVALCYLKTGQTEAARERLEAVVHQAPDHQRGWGNHVVCFEAQVQYETGRLDSRGTDATLMVKLWGTGVVAAYCRTPLQSLVVTPDQSVHVRVDCVIGWLGRLLPRLVPPVEAPAGISTMVGFSGQGSVLLDIG